MFPMYERVSILMQSVGRHLVESSVDLLRSLHGLQPYRQMRTSSIAMLRRREHHPVASLYIHRFVS
jgi:hypothetical protein